MSSRIRLILFLIIALGVLLRFYGLGQYPISLDWDEASLGYNAYSILKTGKDEYGNLLPLQFRSFGDYKPPLYVYLITPFIPFLGLSELAVRLPSALLGSLSIFFVFLLVKDLFINLSKKYCLLITFLFAVSPWHIQFSRVAFEANVGLFWFILGTYLFINISKNRYLLFLSATSFVLSVYTYHSLRLVVPLFVLGLSLIYKSALLKNLKITILSVILGLLLLTPLFFLIKEGVQARFTSVTSITPESLTKSIEQMEFDIERGDFLGKLMHNRRIIYVMSVIKGYLNHWDLSFLFVSGDGPDRHHAPDMGMLYFIELPFVLIGIFSLVFSKSNPPAGGKVLLWWFIIAPSASALTTGTPHAVRALLFLPTYQVFTGIGIKKIIDFVKIKPIFLVVIYTISIYYYLDMYYIHGSIEQAKSWQYGYKQAVYEVAKIKDNYDKIIVSYVYDQPYVYFLFYEKIDPVWYQKNWGEGEIKRSERAWGKYEFRYLDWGKDKELKNTLIVASSEEIPFGEGNTLKEIYFPDGKVAFRIVAL